MRKNMVTWLRKCVIAWLIPLFTLPMLITTPTYGTEEAPAGKKGFSYEYVYINASDWTTLMLDLENGNFLLSQETVVIPGTRYSLSVELTYNAFHSAVASPFGLGWSSVASERLLSVTGSDQKIYQDPSGAKWVFQWNTLTNQYDIPAGTQYKLRKLSDGSYSLRTPDQKDRRFDTEGKIIQWRECDVIMVEFQYNEQKQLIRLVDTLSQRNLSLQYAQDGKITSVTDSMNQSWQFEYNTERNHLVTIKKPNNQSMAFQYTNHLITAVTDFTGKSYSVTYNTETPPKTASISIGESQTYAFGYSNIDQTTKKTTLTNPTNATIDYIFQKNTHRLMKVKCTVNTVNHQLEFSYTPQGMIEKIYDSTGDFVQYEYNADHQLTKTVYPPIMGTEALEIQRVYDPNTGLLLEVREKVNTIPTWAVTKYEYTDQDALCLPSSVTDALGTETIYDYNSHHLMLSSITGTGSYAENLTKATLYTYLPNGNREKSLDPEGNETTYQYNQNGFEVSRVRFEGTSQMNNPVSLLSKTYNVNNQLTDQSDTQNNLSISMTYDANGFQLSQTKSSGCSTSQTVAMPSVIALKPIIDFRNQGSCQTPSVLGIINQFLPVNTPNPAGYRNASLFSYSPLLATVTNSLQHMTTFTYDLSGNLKKDKNYLDRENNYQVDSLGRTTQVTDFTNRTISYQYNTDSKVLSANDSLQGITSFFYNAMGDKISSQDSVQGFLSYQYNLKGNLLSDYKGFYTVDLLGRKTASNYFSGQTDQWTYSREGYILVKNGVNQPRNFLGQVTAFENETGGQATLSREESTGLINSWMGTGDIATMQFNYLNHTWLNQLTDLTKQLSFQYAWTSYGFLSAQTFPNQIQTAYTDKNKLLDKVVTKFGQQVYLESDPSFNQIDTLTNESDTLNINNSTLTYGSTLTRDSLQRIQSIQYQDNQTVQYGYLTNSPLVNSIQISGEGTYPVTRDPQSRIQQIRYPNAQFENYSYNNMTNHIAGIQYANGSSLAFTWNSQDKITQIVGIENNQLLVLSVTYDGEGRIKRLSKIIQGMEAEAWQFSYHPTGIDKAVRSQNGIPNLTLDFTTDLYGKILSATYLETNGYQGEIIYHTNALGNTSLLTDQQGQPLAGWLYRLHNGQITDSYNPMNISPLFGWQADQQKMTFSLLQTGPALSLSIHGEATLHNSFGFLALQSAELYIAKHTGIPNNGSNIGTCADDCESTGKVKCCTEFRNKDECERSCNDKSARDNNEDPGGESMEECLNKCMSNCVKWDCCDKVKAY